MIVLRMPAVIRAPAFRKSPGQRSQPQSLETKFRVSKRWRTYVIICGGLGSKVIQRVSRKEWMNSTHGRFSVVPAFWRLKTLNGFQAVDSGSERRARF